MRCRGSILILVLFVLMVLSLVAVSFAYRAGLEHRAASHRVVWIQLRAQAASAAAIALGRMAENTNDFDHRAEPWHSHPSLNGDEWLSEWSVAVPVFETTYQVTDEEGKLNVLFASSEALEKLGMSAIQIDSLFDWMDDDDQSRPEGAEGEYYLATARGYQSKDAPIEVLEELLAIRGFSPDDYLGEDDNRNRRLDINENDGGVTHPVDNADGDLQFGWVDLLTCVGDGRININTAPREVLATLPLSEAAADQIIGYRTFDEHSSGHLEEHVFRSVSDIEELQGLTDADRGVLKSISIFRSTHFRVFVQAKHLPTGLTYHLQVLAQMTDDGPQVLQWQTEM